MLVDKSQTYLELSLNIIDIMLEFLTSESLFSYSGLPQDTCFYDVGFLLLLFYSVIPVSLLPPACSTELNKCLQCVLKGAKVVLLDSIERRNI